MGGVGAGVEALVGADKLWIRVFKKAHEVVLGALFQVEDAGAEELCAVFRGGPGNLLQTGGVVGYSGTKGDIRTPAGTPRETRVSMA